MNRRAFRVVGFAAVLVSSIAFASAGDSASTTVSEAKGLSKTFHQVAAAAAPSIVSLEVRLKPGMGWSLSRGGNSSWDEASPEPGRWRLPQLQRQSPMVEFARATHVGSGFLIDTNGSIVTAYHVVEHADEIHVRTHDGHEFLATTILTDPQSDVAVLRIPASDGLKPLRFGNSDKLDVGEWVLAVGDPYNTGAIVTAGIISTKGRGPSVLEHSDFLETTAVINLGNSGGPLLNLDGEVVGINTLFQHPSHIYDGIHFAVPSNTARWTSHQLLDRGKVRRCYIGVNLRDIDFRVAQQHRVAPWSGALVWGVVMNSPAEDAGIREGDIVIEFDGHKVATTRGLQRRIEREEPGKSVDVVVLRHGQRHQLVLKLKEFTEQSAAKPPTEIPTK
ncbi:MAG: trypsin-like peptidase domain-containing protein [Planctomycetia bacterium]|nr:trypsin-like peptidase domain-containing protein [Planctomycetia bacterium]